MSNRKKSSTNNTGHVPDPKKHQYYSFIKSGLRIIGFSFLLFNIGIAALLLIAAEILGIAEELV